MASLKDIVKGGDVAAIVEAVTSSPGGINGPGPIDFVATRPVHNVIKELYQWRNDPAKIRAIMDAVFSIPGLDLTVRALPHGYLSQNIAAMGMPPKVIKEMLESLAAAKKISISELLAERSTISSALTPTLLRLAVNFAVGSKDVSRVAMLLELGARDPQVLTYLTAPPEKDDEIEMYRRKGAGPTIKRLIQMIKDAEAGVEPVSKQLAKDSPCTELNFHPGGGACWLKGDEVGRWSCGFRASNELHQSHTDPRIVAIAGWVVSLEAAASGVVEYSDGDYNWLGFAIDAQLKPSVSNDGEVAEEEESSRPKRTRTTRGAAASSSSSSSSLVSSSSPKDTSLSNAKRLLIERAGLPRTVSVTKIKLGSSGKPGPKSKPKAKASSGTERDKYLLWMGDMGDVSEFDSKAEEAHARASEAILKAVLPDTLFSATINANKKGREEPVCRPIFVGGFTPDGDIIGLFTLRVQT